MAEMAPVSNLEQYVDMEDALKRVCGNKTLYKRLLGTLQKSLPMDQLRAQAQAGDAEAAAHTAHTIKGVVANLSLKAAYEKVVAVEAQLKAGAINMADLDELDDILQTTLRCTEYIASTL